MFRAEYKVEGGKLIKVQVSKRGEKIDFVRITGDFFMHPEELIEDLEKALVGCPLDEKVIAEAIRCFVRDKGVVLLGVSPEDFARCIIRAVSHSG
ncbi:hypothetical protein KEJ29_05410 [Candidatus Bathyarchaeota archaeon]|nr:hypothetical protein [Candidatus Bathyarchaeota archaeon]